MKKNYHLIPYDFEECDFESLRRQEREGGGTVLWQHGRRKHRFNKGDICYIYCTRLPDLSRRILLRAEVSEPECMDEDNILCFALRKFTAIRLIKPIEDGEDIPKYSLENLRDKYNIGIVRGKQKLDSYGKHKELVEALESEPKDGNLNAVKKYYENVTKCVFNGLDHNPKVHESFIKPNGFTYFETHHVIQQNTLKNKSIDEEIIDDPNNKVYLCPTCHRKIHYGQAEDVKWMIDKLFEKGKEFYEGVFSEYAKDDGADSSLEWLYNMYKVGD